METDNFLIKEEKRLHFIIGLIADDLKIQKHLHLLSQSGLDSSLLQLKIHDKIFALAGIEEQKIDDSLREWYFQMAEKAFALDLFHDEIKLLEVASEILVELNRKQLV